MTAISDAGRRQTVTSKARRERMEGMDRVDMFRAVVLLALDEGNATTHRCFLKKLPVSLSTGALRILSTFDRSRFTNPALLQGLSEAELQK
jgi:hypothetical protein